MSQSQIIWQNIWTYDSTSGTREASILIGKSGMVLLNPLL